jgi:hypothetical protein
MKQIRILLVNFLILFSMVTIGFGLSLYNQSYKEGSKENMDSFTTANSDCGASVKYLCSRETRINNDGNCLQTYITGFLVTYCSNQFIAYIVENQYSASITRSCELAGGLNTNAICPQWTGHVCMEYAAYSNEPKSPNNPPSSWEFNPNSISQYASPNNQILWGETTEVTVTYGIKAGATDEGIGIKGTYSYASSYSQYEFCIEPLILEHNEVEWQYSDNQGLHSTPYSSTTYLLTMINVPDSSIYQHIYLKSYGEFRSISCTTSGACGYVHSSPTSQMTVCTGGGFNFDIEN